MDFEIINDWHKRFIRQAHWTSDLRSYLFKQLDLDPNKLVLDVGCGTGVILNELEKLDLRPFGMDIDKDHLHRGMQIALSTRFTQGDAQSLPYPDNFFDVVLCHFLLMWVDDPIRAIAEMARVTKPGGSVLSLAEPDYGGRIDYPEELEILGQNQVKSLYMQGADPLLGRKLAYLFNQAGLKSVHTGVLGGQWSDKPDWDSWESEWRVFESDIIQNSTITNIEQVSRLKDKDRISYEIGVRVLFVPTFYAWGIVG
jgi:ubiquinone/menaquinone biosynthesis C-methylase UbiE